LDSFGAETGIPVVGHITPSGLLVIGCWFLVLSAEFWLIRIFIRFGSVAWCGG
jgi:hypothetical protein